MSELKRIGGLFHKIIYDNKILLLVSIVVAFAFGPRLVAVVSGNNDISSTLLTYTDAIARVGDSNLANTPVSQLTDGVISQVLNSVSLPEPIASILENNQTPEGIRVPKVLVPYMRCEIID